MTYLLTEEFRRVGCHNFRPHRKLFSKFVFRTPGSLLIVEHNGIGCMKEIISSLNPAKWVLFKQFTH